MKVERFEYPVSARAMARKPKFILHARGYRRHQNETETAKQQLRRIGMLDKAGQL